MVEQQRVAVAATTQLQPNDVVDNRWLLGSKIGAGSFGVVFMCSSKQDENDKNDDRISLVIKVEVLSEKRRRPVLNSECRVMKAMSSKSGFPSLVACGVDDEHQVYYAVMEYAGPSVFHLKKANRLNSCEQLVDVGSQAVKCLQEFHESGFVHRDVKPSNILLQHGKVTLIDFGLSRRYQSQPRENIVGLRGTPRYASLNAHDHVDLSCRDDLWSLFYSLLELSLGYLPWSKAGDPKIVAQIKRSCRDPQAWPTPHLPAFFEPLQTYLDTLTYSEVPRYDHIVCILRGTQTTSSKSSSSCSSSSSSSSTSSSQSMSSRLSTLQTTPTPPTGIPPTLRSPLLRRVSRSGGG